MMTMKTTTATLAVSGTPSGQGPGARFAQVPVISGTENLKAPKIFQM